MSLKRFGVSLEDDLLESLDDYVKNNSFANRSQAIRFLIEKNVAEQKWQCDHIVAGYYYYYV
jgi:CopG family nickel-responsive transcriptional regulator